MSGAESCLSRTPGVRRRELPEPYPRVHPAGIRCGSLQVSRSLRCALDSASAPHARRAHNPPWFKWIGGSSGDAPATHSSANCRCLRMSRKGSMNDDRKRKSRDKRMARQRKPNETRSCGLYARLPVAGRRRQRTGVKGFQMKWFVSRGIHHASGRAGSSE